MLFNEQIKDILFDIWQRHSVLDWKEIKEKTNDAGELAVQLIKIINEDQFECSDLLEFLDRNVKYVDSSIQLYYLSGDQLKKRAIELREAFEEACINCIDKKIEIQSQIECILNAYSIDLQSSAREYERSDNYDESNYL